MAKPAPLEPLTLKFRTPKAGSIVCAVKSLGYPDRFLYNEDIGAIIRYTDDWRFARKRFVVNATPPDSWKPIGYLIPLEDDDG